MSMHLRGMRISPRYAVIALVVVVVAAIGATLAIVSSAHKSKTLPEQLLYIDQYAVVLDESGLITTPVIEGPFSGTIDGDYVVFDSLDIGKFGNPSVGYRNEIDVDGETHAFRTSFQGVISRDDAVKYYNQVVKVGGEISLDSAPSLERVMTYYAFDQIGDAFNSGQLPKVTYEINGLPTIAYNAEVAANYANYNAEKLAWERDQQRKLEAIEQLCNLYPELEINDERCESIVGEPSDGQTVAHPPPYGPSSDVDDGYDFLCSTLEVVATNWSDASSQFASILDTDLFSFTELESGKVYLETAEPCGYVTTNPVANAPSGGDDPAVSISDCESPAECGTTPKD